MSAVFEWVPCHDGELPAGTTQIGEDKDGTKLYAGRARHSGDLLPAKVKPNHHGAYVCWGGDEELKTKYEVLVRNDVAWKHTTNGNIRMSAMVIGHTGNGEPLYFGRAYHEGTVTPGKVHPSHKCLYIPYGGEEIAKTEYEIMVLLTS